MPAQPTASSTEMHFCCGRSRRRRTGDTKAGYEVKPLDLLTERAVAGARLRDLGKPLDLSGIDVTAQ